MEIVLINPNKCRAFGIPICDDPTNYHRPLVIEEDFNTHIPMLMVGFTCEFITWYPTYDKIETCGHINVSYKHNWGPSKHIFKIYSMEDEKSIKVFNLRLINQVRIQTP